MKKTIIAIVAIATVAVSCTKTEVVDSQFSEKAIGFKTYTSATKAYSTGDVTLSVMQGDKFSVTGYYNNDVYLGKDVAQQYTSGNWEYVTASEMKFWPTAAGAAMDFYAYFPSSATASFSDSNASGTVMTISAWGDGQDVLYATTLAQTKVARTALTFNHALSKIKAVNLATTLSDLSIAVSAVELVATATDGSIKVDADGTVSYVPTASTELKKTGLSLTTTSSASKDLIANSDNGYILPIASGIWVNNPQTAVSTSVALKLTAVVTMNGVELHNGAIYVPLGVSALAAGKSYTFNVTMSNGIGYDENGNDIVLPIKFSASVTDWADQTAVNIVL